MKGKFITFEGIDGAGKSSHVEWLAEWLREKGQVVHVTREPGGTELGEKLRELLLHDPMHLETETLLMFAARREHLARVIEPALNRGEWVVCDRFSDATYAYQGGGRGFDLNVLSTLEQWTQTQNKHLLQPQLTLWFDLPAEVAAERLAGARVPDKFEAQPVEFFRQVAHGYQKRMDADPARFVKINANQNRDAVWAEVLQAVRAKGYLA